MATAELIFSVTYVLLGFCLIAPPTEFVAGGVTVQNLLGNILGSEEMNFAYYHIRRSTATMVIHSLLPFGYYIGYALFAVSHPNDFLSPWNLNFYWQIFLTISLLLPTCTAVLAFLWSRQQWRHHPIARTLALHAPHDSTWQAVASSINVEFRRVDKFASGTLGHMLIVTDNWIIQTSTYSLSVAHQSDVHLTLVASEEHALSYETAIGVQYLNITVSSVREGVKPFKIRLNAEEYRDLQDKLQSPVRNARAILIKQTLSDRFLEVFKEHVDRNPDFSKPPEMELETCIGCMQKTADVKLQKLCDMPSQGDCVSCYCRPMWCLECMGKWFANRQNQSDPESWLSSKAHCPTCRSTFCMLDISRITT